ncbi:glycoside hydrolase [Pilobolus umbonatus]|nr:glycoside hydrolase [Pilobolus umbonatus]
MAGITICNMRILRMKDNINVNDVLGDYSLTLVDSLDTIAIMGTQAEFEDAVERVIEVVSFHQDNKVQIFELNIRALEMAVNLADRLLPAFKSTKTGIPYPRVNLKKGVPPTETTETCTAGAGSLILEFGVLSRLTGNPEYERVAKRALKSIWSRRSQINLLGNVIDIQTGQWIHTASSTGAGIDSVFEYMLKAYILFGEVDYLNMFDEAYKALMTHVRDSSGYLYRNVHMSTGSLMSTWIDSLSAFFPGLQVLYGDLDSAIRNHLVFYNIWRRYHAIPERFDFYQRGVDLPFYPLRPEFIESTYHLYTATKDPFYLQVGEMVIEDLNNRTRIPCGFASIGDVQTGRLEDRMESFMLSETIKYLYLLFNEDSHINKMDSNYVFTTEGHILPLPKRYLRSPGRSDKKPSIKENHGTCQKYQPLNHVYKQNRRGNNIHLPVKIDTSSIPYQPQSDYASEIVGYTGSETPPVTNHGFCEVPTVATKSFALTFGYPNINKYFDSHVKYTTSNLIELIGGYLAKSVSGLRLEVVNKGGNGYIMKGG